MIYISTASSHPKIASLGKALTNLGHITFLWNSKNISLFDLLSDKSPDLVVLTDDDIEGNKIAEYAKNEYPDTKLIWMRSNSNLTNTDGLDLVIDIENKNTDHEYMDYYVESDYLDGVERDRFKCDYVIISNGMDPDNKEQLRWINMIGNLFNIKIYGNQKIRSVFYLGEPDDSEYKDIMSSALGIILFNERFINTAVQNNLEPILFGRKSDNKYIKTVSSFKEFMDITNRYIYREPDTHLKTYQEFTESILDMCGLTTSMDKV